MIIEILVWVLVGLFALVVILIVSGTIRSVYLKHQADKSKVRKR